MIASEALRLQAKLGSPDAYASLVPQPVRLAPGPGEVVVEVRSAGVNPSDAKAALGAMPHAVWPRTPGRDYAGVVVEGPPGLLGRAVWGTGGDLGITRDGSHARHILLPEAAIREVPQGVDLIEAGSVGVPFFTAWDGLREAGGVRPGEVVLVLGANGRVGQAAIQLASRAGARVFAAARDRQPFRHHASAPVTMLVAEDIAAELREATAGHGADIVFNTVGSPYFAAGCAAMALGARQVFIATIDRAVPFDIFAFYRGRHRFIGIDTLATGTADCAAMLDALAPGFADGTLRPYPVPPSCRFPLARAGEAYQLVFGGAPDRVVLTPAG